MNFRRRLGRASRLRVPAPPPGGWRRTLEASIRERTAGVVWDNLSGADAPPEIAAAFERVRASVSVRNLTVTRQAAVLLRLFGDLDIPCIPLKGFALLHRLYRAPGLRDMGDLDLLVRPRDAATAAAAESLGYRKAEELPPPGSVYRRSVQLVTDDGVPLHLHWHVLNASLPVFMARVPMEEIWEESRAADFGGAPAMAMRPEHLFVTLCEHAMKHSFDALIHLTDLAALLEEVDPGAAAEIAVRWNLAVPMALALSAVEWEMGVKVPAEAWRRLRPFPRAMEDRLFLAFLRAGRRWNGMSALGYLAMTGGTHGRWRFIAGTLRPPAEDVRSFGKRPGMANVLHRMGRVLRMALQTE